MKLLNDNVMFRKFLLTILVVLSMPVSVYTGHARSAEAERGSAEFFAKPFSCVFNATLAYSRYNDESPVFKFYDNGTAVLFHNIFYSVYECYSYTTDGHSVWLDGICTLQDNPMNFSLLPDKPENMVLEFAGYGETASLNGSATGNPGHTYSLSMAASDHINRYYNGVSLLELIDLYKSGMPESTENLWLVTGEYGAAAYNGTEAGAESVAGFSKGNIIEGTADPGGEYLTVDYMGGQKLYIDLDEVNKIRNVSELHEILYADAGAFMDFSTWKHSLVRKAEIETSAGYFNGLKAGRGMAAAFLPILAMLVILTVLNVVIPLSHPNFLYYFTYIFLVLLSFFEVWYALSVKEHMFWFITSPKDFVHGFAAGVATFVYIFVRLYLLLVMEGNLAFFCGAWSRFPRWLELILVIVAMAAGMMYIFSGSGWDIPIAYLLLLAASLPVSIGYLVHASEKAAMLPFLLFCYPMKYLYAVPLLLLYVMSEAMKVKVLFSSRFETTDEYGNTIFVTRKPDGTFEDDAGDEVRQSPYGFHTKDGRIGTL